MAVALGLILMGAGSAFADPSPTPGSTGPAIPVPTAVAPTTVCSLPSSVTNISGMVATSSGYVVVNELTDANATRVITYLTSGCSKDHVKSYSRTARDPEDIVADKSGNLWIADIGDPNLNRPTLALWKVPANGGPTVLYHFVYPGATPHMAKAMVLDGDGRPIFITQPASGSGPAEMYEPAAGPLATSSTVNTPLINVGSFTPEDTGTDNKLEGPGRLLVTGGANSPDGTKVVLRTYSDAYEWTVTGGDVVKAIKTTTPLITPMPHEPQGEAISYTADGKDFVTVSNQPSSTPILKYTPSTPAIVKAAASAAAAKAPKKPSALRTWLTSLSLTDLKIMLGAVAVVGLALVLLGVFGIRRSRRKYRAEMAAAVRDRPANGPGGPARAPVGAASPGVYGAPPGNPGRGGNVYGGGPGGAAPGTYGAPRGGGYDPAPVDPYGQPRPSSGGPAGGGTYSGGNYGPGQYGPPADPYQGGPEYGAPDYGPPEYGPPDGRRRPPTEYDGYR